MVHKQEALKGLLVHSELAMLVDEDERLMFGPFTTDSQVWFLYMHVSLCVYACGRRTVIWAH